MRPGSGIGGVGRSDIIRGVRRFLDLKGDYELGVSGEVLPVMVAGDLRGGPFRWSRGGAGTHEAVATVGEFSQIILSNTTQTRNVLHVKSWHASVGAAAQVRLVMFRGVSGPTLNGASTAAVQDWDIMAGFTPDEHFLVAGTNASLGTPNAIFFRGGHLAGDVRRYPDEFVVRPGCQICIQCLTANTSLIGGFYFDLYDVT